MAHVTKIDITKLLPLSEQPTQQLAAWARRRRGALGLTRAAMARRARLRQADVELFEAQGEAEGTAEARQLARAYGVPVLVLEIWLGYFRLDDLEELLRWFAGRSSSN